MVAWPNSSKLMLISIAQRIVSFVRRTTAMWLPYLPHTLVTYTRAYGLWTRDAAVSRNEITSLGDAVPYFKRGKRELMDRGGWHIRGRSKSYRLI